MAPIHSWQLDNICRVCGVPQGQHKLGSAIKYRELILTEVGVDIAYDTPRVHPKKLCFSCMADLKYRNARRKEDQPLPPLYCADFCQLPTGYGIVCQTSADAKVPKDKSKPVREMLGSAWKIPKYTSTSKPVREILKSSRRTSHRLTPVVKDLCLTPPAAKEPLDVPSSIPSASVLPLNYVSSASTPSTSGAQALLHSMVVASSNQQFLLSSCNNPVAVTSGLNCNALSTGYASTSVSDTSVSPIQSDMATTNPNSNSAAKSEWSMSPNSFEAVATNENETLVGEETALDLSTSCSSKQPSEPSGLDASTSVLSKNQVPVVYHLTTTQDHLQPSTSTSSSPILNCETPRSADILHSYSSPRYDCNQFLDPGLASNVYSCAKCRLVSLHSAVASCGHIYCQSCQSMFQETDTCLKCETEVQRSLGCQFFQLSDDLQAEFENLSLRCRNYTSGCPFMCLLNDAEALLSHHEAACSGTSAARVDQRETVETSSVANVQSLGPERLKPLLQYLEQFSKDVRENEVDVLFATLMHKLEGQDWKHSARAVRQLWAGYKEGSGVLRKTEKMYKEGSAFRGQMMEKKKQHRKRAQKRKPQMDAIVNYLWSKNEVEEEQDV